GQARHLQPVASHVTITAGHYFGSDSMSDDDIRRLYNRARAVIVPLKDVYQPSGYSVTLQVMSCGRPVVLTKTRGLWAPEHFVDGENCLLVPPGDAAALGAAIGRLRSLRVLEAGREKPLPTMSGSTGAGRDRSRWPASACRCGQSAPKGGAPRTQASREGCDQQ